MKPAAQIQTTIELLETLHRGVSGITPAIPADNILMRAFRGKKFIGSHDRRFIAQTFYGILREYQAIQWWLGKARTSRLEVFCYLLLTNYIPLERLSSWCDGEYHHPQPLDSYELMTLEKIVKKAFQDNKDMRYGVRQDMPILAEMPPHVQGNCPAFILPSLEQHFGDNTLPELIAQKHEATLDLRVNTLKATREQVQQVLTQAGIQTELTPYSPWGLRIQGRHPLPQLEAFKQGLFEVQDEGSQLIALLVGASEGEAVLDFCAGAAGKTLALAAAMQNKGRLVAMDVSVTRLRQGQQRLRRAGVCNTQIKPLDQDSRSWLKRHHNFFNRVLIDAPCTGTGTWRRNPDLRLRLTPTHLQELQEKQKSILEQAAVLVKAGGRLIYATCSLLPEENEHIIEQFLQTHTDYQLMPIQEIWGQILSAPYPATGSFLRTTPRQHNMDGFFTAVLQRN